MYMTGVWLVLSLRSEHFDQNVITCLQESHFGYDNIDGVVQEKIILLLIQYYVVLARTHSICCGHICSHLSMLRKTPDLIFWCWNQNYHRTTRQYHGCWSACFFCCQVISNRGMATEYKWALATTGTEFNNLCYLNDDKWKMQLHFKFPKIVSKTKG